VGRYETIIIILAWGVSAGQYGKIGAMWPGGRALDCVFPK
jgi:hypothetical protein